MARLIKVSNYVYDKLMILKKRENHTSFDSVLRELLHNYEGLPYRRGK